MTLSAAIDWATIYSALYDWVNGVLGWTTVWADQPAPRPEFPYVTLDVIADSKEGGLDEVSRSVDLTRARFIRVTPTAANSTLYRVTINGTNYDYTSDADATVAEITAGLTSAINGGVEPVAATDNGTDLDIAGDDETANPGTPGLFTVTVTGPLAWANNDAGNEVAIRVTGSTEFTLNVQAFQRNTDTDYAATDPARNAYAQLTTLRASLGLPSVQAALRAVNVAVIEEQAITDLSEEVEDTFLSRASLDIRMRTLSELTEYQGFIAQVSGASTYAGSNDSPISDSYTVDGE